jgi:hypothetical protein
MSHRSIAVWLVQNTKLTLQQIADFCEISKIEVQTIADGKYIIKTSSDPVACNMLTMEEIHRCEQNATASLEENHDALYDVKVCKQVRRVSPNDIIAGILWMLKKHSQISDQDIAVLTGAEISLVESMRQRESLKIGNIKAQSPVTLGLCLRTEFNELVGKDNLL